MPWCAAAARNPTTPLATDERWQHIRTPTLKWDDHGAQTAAKIAARAAAAQAAERQARAEQQLEAAESRAREEQQAALRAETEALALRQSEEAAARQSEDAATVASEAALLSARRRRELESARSAVVEAEAVQERSSRSAEQAERSHSQAADEAESAEQAAGRAKRQLGGKAPRRSRRVAGGGALSSRLSPRELSDPDVVCFHPFDLPWLCSAPFHQLLSSSAVAGDAARGGAPRQDHPDRIAAPAATAPLLRSRRLLRGPTQSLERTTDLPSGVHAADTVGLCGDGVVVRWHGR